MTASKENILEFPEKFVQFTVNFTASKENILESPAKFV
jgi:hypothetical protein